MTKLTHSCCLWDFACFVYGQPGVAEQCLALQEQYAVRVNILLANAWLSARGVSVSSAQLQHLLRESQHWHEHTVQTLRQSRRWIKAQSYLGDSANACYQAITAAELSAERAELQILQALIRTWPGADTTDAIADAALANCWRYLQECSVSATQCAQTIELLQRALVSELDSD